MRAPYIALTALSIPAAAIAEPYAVAKLAYASSDLPLGAPYNGVIDDDVPALAIDIGFGFTRKWALEVGAARYASLDGFGTPCVPNTVCALVVREIDGSDMTMYKVALVPRFTAGDAHMFARAGYYRANIDANVDLPGAGETRPRTSVASKESREAAARPPARPDVVGAPQTIVRARLTEPDRARGRGKDGAGNETRTRDPDLGKVVLYQLSYSRFEAAILRPDAPAGNGPVNLHSRSRIAGQAARR